MIAYQHQHLQFSFLASLFIIATAASSCQPPPTIQLVLGNCTILAPDQTDINSWGIHIRVEDSTELCVVPSTVVNSTLLQSSEICDSDQLNDSGLIMTAAQCRSRRGGFITRSAVPNATTDGLELLNPGWTSLPNVIQYAADATLRLLTDTVTMVEVLITQGQQSSASHLGLAEESTLLKSLHDAGMIGAKSWGLNSGSQSVLYPREGSLVLGGYDESSLSGPFFEYDIAEPNLLNHRPCPLQILVSKLTLNIDDADQNGSYDLIDAASKLTFCIEPYDNQFRLPQAIWNGFLQYFRQHTNYSGALVSPSTYSPGWNVEPGLVYPSSFKNFNATLRFTIDNGLTVDIPYYELERPLRVLDTDGRPSLNTSYQELQIFNTAAPEDAPVLGKAFLSQLYLFIDYEKMKFSLAQQNLEAGGARPVSSANCATAQKLDPTAKGLIGVGVVLGMLILVLSIYILYRCCWKPQQPHKAMRDIPSASNPTPETVPKQPHLDPHLDPEFT
ncbi:hypothetical protein O988_05436 [Pseudogymnoascus sp. VKM F-3808]|nr:hypothetical protein O988_05436 [Pseudogymnoascus sp. VKM F-3808]